MKFPNIKCQRGLTTVEFAVIGTTLLLVLFGVLEVSRALYIWNTMGEVTRRGARVATVCPMNSSAIREVAIVTAPGGGEDSPVSSDLTVDNIQLDYLDEDGELTATFAEVSYVRVSIVNYTHMLLIPFLPAEVRKIEMPPFTTTLPRESLGFSPDNNDYRCFSPGI